MPRVPMSLLLHLLRSDRRGRRLAARHRRHGVAGLRRFRRHMRDLRRIRREGWNRQVLRRDRRNGAGPSNRPVQPRAPLQPVQPPAPLQVDENIDPALAAPPPPFWCSVHGWVVCPLHQYDFPVQDPPLQPVTPAVVEGEAGAPPMWSPAVARGPGTPLVRVRDGDALAFVSAPTGASAFAFGSGVGGSSNRMVVDVDAVAPRLPSPTPTTPPPSPRAAARRRLLALGLPLARPSTDSPTNSRGHGASTWSLAALGLAHGASNGVAPGTLLPGASSDEEEGGRNPRRL